MFNDLRVYHYNDDGSVAQRISVPIIFAPREKFLARLDVQPGDAKKIAINLPMISFEITGLEYDTTRHLQKTRRIISKTPATSQYDGVYVPVPYNINYDVNLYAASVEDGARLIEQILPFFTPSWNATVHLLDELPDLSTDVYIDLVNITPEDQSSPDFQSRQAVIWRLSLKVQTYFYGPVSPKKVIKFATVNIYGDTLTNNSGPSAVITTQPGMDANGNATSNVSVTVPYQNIEETDSWDYIIQITEPSNT